MTFDNADDLARHQKKFCTDGEYGNLTKLERRQQNLVNNNDHQNDLGMADIKAYLRGDDPTIMGGGGNGQSMMARESLDQMRDYFGANKLKQEDEQRRNNFKKNSDMIDQMQELKKDKHLLRMNKDQDEQDMVDLLRDLEQRKEKELRAQIEKEEINRNLRDLDKKQLGALERERKRELERLAVERENVRLKEQQMMDDVKRMEQQLLEQEKFFRKQKEGAERNPNKDWAMSDIRQKEMNLARERGEQIVKIKAQRDRLENERARIMSDLEHVKAGNLPAMRKNDAARLVGSQASKHYNTVGPDDHNYQYLEPSLKDKLVNDQVKVNYLREQHRKTLQDEMMPEIDELDVLQKGLQGRHFAEDAGNLMNEYDGRNTPNRPLYLGTIRQKLEAQNQPAAPSSYHPNNNRVSFQADLPEHIPHGEGKKLMLDNLQGLKNEYLIKGGEDKEFVNKVNDLEGFLLYNQALPKRQSQLPPPIQPSQNEILISNGSQSVMPPPMYPPFQGMGGMPPPFMAGMPPPYGPPGGGGLPPPFQDPMMMQMQSLVQQSEMENQKLREALEGLGDYGNNEFDQIINNAKNELNAIKGKILPSGGLGQTGTSLGGGGEANEDPFPEDFVFRQNEFRCEDLEVEERAQMNLAAAEYDQLRIIAKLPVNSELYRYKMDQFKELSTIRSEISKVLEEQRLEKVRRDFEKQKYEDERRFKHDKWLEDQKRSILEAKLKNAQKNEGGGPYEEVESRPNTQKGRQMFSRQMEEDRPQTVQTEVQTEMQPPVTRPTNYDLNQGFLLLVDHLFNLPREVKSMRLVYSVFNGKKCLVDPRLIETKQAAFDQDSPNYRKIFYQSCQVIKHVPINPHSNLLIELQSPDPNKTQGFSSYGWSILNLFDQQENLNKGRWRLPIYRPNTVLDLDVKEIYKLSPMHQLLLCIRIAQPKDAIHNFQINDKTYPALYQLPFIHDVHRNGDEGIGGRGRSRREEQFQPPQLPKDRRQPLENRDGSILVPPSAQLHKDPNYEVSGIQLYLHYLRNLKNFAKVKLQATLYQGVSIVKQDNYQDCNWATLSVDKSESQVAPKGSRVEIGLDGRTKIVRPPAQDLVKVRDYGNNVHGVSGLDEYILPVEQENTWQRDLYAMLWDHNMKDNLYLLIQVFVVQQSKVMAGGNNPQYDPIGYTVFKVNNEDGTIRFGTFEQPLYRMPIDLLNQEESQMISTNLKFSLVQPKSGPMSLRQQLPSRGADSQGRPYSHQFIPNFEKQYTAADDFQPGDGIDVYIDWARHLPENTMFSKLYVRCLNSDLNQPVAGQRGFASIEFSTAKNPFYGFKYEIRDPSANPTLLLCIVIETIDRSNGQPRIAGHSFFPIFMDKVSKLPITDPKSRNFTLHKGFYQMPMYAQNPNFTTPFTYENYIYLERTPTASMLVRIYKAPRKPDGTIMSLDNVPVEHQQEENVLIQAPVYEDGIYNTQYFYNTPQEKKLFNLRRQRKDPRIEIVLDQTLKLKNRYNAGMNDDQKLDIVDQLITLPPNAQMIDLNYFSQYNQDIGFRVGVEAIHKNKDQAFFNIVMSVCPMAEFYQPYRSGPPSDVTTFSALNWDSNINTMKFEEDLVVLQKIKESNNVVLIFDIKKFTIGQNKFTDYGYSVFPLFETLGNDEVYPTLEFYINSGIFSLPIFSGAPTPEIIQAFKSTINSRAQLTQFIQSGKLKPLSPTSLIIKVIDNQRERHLEKSFEQIPPSTKFLPNNILSNLQYKPLQPSELAKLPKLQSLIPKGQTVNQFQQFLTDFFNTQYKL